MSHVPSNEPLQRTPLFEVCQEAGGRMIDFGGWELPVQFTGILEEHAAVRERAGLFDVSHMGEILVRGAQAEAFLQKCTCNDVAKLTDGRIHYTGLLYPTGGFVDDILTLSIMLAPASAILRPSFSAASATCWMREMSEAKVATIMLH